MFVNDYRLRMHALQELAHYFAGKLARRRELIRVRDECRRTMDDLERKHDAADQEARERAMEALVQVMAVDAFGVELPGRNAPPAADEHAA